MIENVRFSVISAIMYRFSLVKFPATNWRTNRETDKSLIRRSWKLISASGRRQIDLAAPRRLLAIILQIYIFPCFQWKVMRKEMLEGGIVKLGNEYLLIFLCSLETDNS